MMQKAAQPLVGFQKIPPSSNSEHVTYCSTKPMELEKNIFPIKSEVQEELGIVNLQCTEKTRSGNEIKEEKEKTEVFPMLHGEHVADCESESLDMEENILTLVLAELKQEQPDVESKESSDSEGGEEGCGVLREESSSPKSVQSSDHESFAEIFTSGKTLNQRKSSTQFRCKNCKLVLKTREDLQVHKSEHTREKCNVCGKTFSDKYYYVRHMGVHMGVGYKCDECNKVLATSSAFRTHCRSHTGEKSYVCEICGKSYALAQGYKNHMSRHAGIKPFQCPTCPKAFAFKILLQNHILIHTGEKPYICEVCGTNFRDTSGLSRHRKTVHSHEKAYKCTFCPKSYKKPDQLKLHLRTHTGERPYGCEICGRTFAGRTILNNHLRTHTGEKRYDCTYCEKKFSTQSSKTRHVRRHTGETPYECASCHKAFSLRRDLINHIQRLHS